MTDIIKTMREALDKALKEPYKPTKSPVVCRLCGRIYGESIMGPIMGDCGRHK